MSIKRKFRINIIIECNNRADYLAALTAIRTAGGNHVDAPPGTKVVVKQSADKGVNLSELDAP